MYINRSNLRKHRLTIPVFFTVVFNNELQRKLEPRGLRTFAVIYIFYSPVMGARKVFSRGGQIKESGDGSFPAGFRGGTAVVWE